MTWTRSELKLNHGGLMRCCTASLSDWIEDKPQAEVQAGEKIACVYERKDTMIVDETGVVLWSEAR